MTGYQHPPGDVEINAGKAVTRLRVANRGDRPVQVGSHHHFAEADRALLFQRMAAYGQHLDIPAGTAARFEPGETRSVTLVPFGGLRWIAGFHGLAGGGLDEPGARERFQEALSARLRERGARVRISRGQHADLYGPGAGDRFRLADTNLVCEVERDLTRSGDEAVFGGGKTIRDGMAQSSRATRAQGTLDLVITNAVVLDAVLGVVKADIGVRDGRIVAVGKAGNPDVMDGVTHGLVIGTGTEVIAGEGAIATPGGVDSHVHMISPQQVWAALANGITTMLGGGTGPADGSNATTCTPGAWNIAQMLRAAESLPVNWGVMAKGNASTPDPLREQVEMRSERRALGLVGFDPPTLYNPAAGIRSLASACTGGRIRRDRRGGHASQGL